MKINRPIQTLKLALLVLGCAWASSLTSQGSGPLHIVDLDTAALTSTARRALLGRLHVDHGGTLSGPTTR